MKTSIEHLPEKKQRELARIQEILFEEFDLARGKNSQKEYDKKGRILKIVLFGSYARGDWVDEAGKTAKGYQSDFDLLIVVNYKQLTDMATYWYKAEDRIIREKSIKTPIGLIVHSLSEVNDKLAHGQYFFVDIVRDGIALYELEGHRFVDPKPLNEKEAYEMAKEYFDEWLSASENNLKTFEYCLSEKMWKKAAFELHQTVESLYGCYLLTTTLYSPSTHNLKKLRSLVEEKDERFRAIWLDEDRFQRRSFERLKDAYIKARYSKHYVIAEDELGWLGERAKLLANLVQKVCRKRLSGLINVTE
ncbi:nucleotidyltransferase [Marinicaulis flavus]|uniref:Nucleotidyltransferase n=2 Tax=Hyphococcus luteus TaxID=2058213 RepID=A0A2S7K9Y3_9PROT|nr:nucleotidyltransferase [Marinicaulis flavus]